MGPQSDFSRWFNRSYWRAFADNSVPIYIPKSPEEKKRLIKEVYDEIVSCRYAPGLPEREINIDKGHGVSRIVPVFSIRDYCVYYYCIKELEEILCGNRVENTFGGWTLGGKIRKKEQEEIEIDYYDTYGKFSFNPSAWSQAFGEFNSLLFSQLDNDNYEYILQFDLANFYDSIRLNILERCIREDAARDKGEIISLLFYFLNHWNRHNTFYEHQSVGLPQDPLSDCSRILANYYLQKYDYYASEICKKYDSLYFRYSDDQMILSNNPDKLDEVMLFLSRDLDRYGLRVNQKKVILWKNAELQKYRCRKIQSIFSCKEDKSDPNKIKKFVDEYLLLSEKDISETWNDGNPLLNRLLWTKLETLSLKSFKLIVQKFLSKKFLRTANSKSLYRISKLNQMLEFPADFFDILISIGDTTVHNSFHYEVLQFSKDINSEYLEQIFTQRIEQLTRQFANGLV